MIDKMVENSKGLTIAIFPEGTRTSTGKINKFHRGFVHVLRASDMELLPVTLNGFFELKPKTRFSINFNSKLNVVIHPAIAPEELKDKTDQEIMDRAKSVIESAYIEPTL